MRTIKFLVLALSALIFYSGTALAASEQTTTESPSGPSTPGATPSPGKKTTPPVQPRASLTLTCSNGKAFKIATGTGTGMCVVGINTASCEINGKTVSSASCSAGCESTSGSGSCSPVN
jgi:hypothetical protein